MPYLVKVTVSVLLWFATLVVLLVSFRQVKQTLLQIVGKAAQLLLHRLGIELVAWGNFSVASQL